MLEQDRSSDTWTQPSSSKGTAAGYPDLRDWLDRVEQIGQLRRVDGADWRIELGALTEMTCLQSPTPPCLLFDRITDYPPGWRVVTNSLASKERAAMALGLPIDKSLTELVQLWRERSKGLQPLPPAVVEGGPVFENRIYGKDIDLFRFPVPIWHEDDGGRYIGTGCIVITKDPDTGEVNCGTYRVLATERDKAGLYISTGQHGRIHREKYAERGQPMPVAVAFGMDPLLLIAGGLPLTTKEYDWVGGIKGMPVCVTQGPITGLPFPANAEIVIEGKVDPDKTLPEGPFGEFTGYYASGHRNETYIQVEGLYHRDNPILLGAPPMRPPGDHSQVSDIIRTGGIWDALEAAGVPEVRAVGRLRAGGSGFIVISIKQRYAGHAKQAGLVASQSRGANSPMAHYIVVVDEDIDPFNTDDVVWALASRVEPEESVDLIRNCRSSPLDPRLSPEKRARRDFTNSRLVIDATRPFYWRDQFPKVVGTSRELQNKMREKWGEEFFK